MNANRALALLVAAALPAAAAAQRTYIEIGSPNFQPLPIAVAPFRAEPSTQTEAAEMTQTLRTDLALSGLFDVLDPRSFLADPGEGLSAPSIRFSRWADVGAEGLVKALVRGATEGLAGELHLFEVRAGREVLTKEHRGGPRDARRLAHAFADDIVQYYTREPSVFRTRIAARRASASGRDIVAFDVDGKNLEVLWHDTEPVALPAWRPDGGAILFTRWVAGRRELWQVELPSKRARALLARGTTAIGGAWSPDGRRIALTVEQAGRSDIWTTAADGSDPRRLTTSGVDTSPTWSPDGRRIAFASTRTGNSHLYVMNADGSDQRRITFQGTNNTTPRWSPRGDLIVFTARDERRVFDIFTISPESGKIQRVTQDQGNTNWEPTWAPNGRLLAFASDRGGAFQIVVSSPSGDRQQVVTSGAGELDTPAWGPLPR